MTNLRYKNIFSEIDKCKPKTILELGTWNGVHAAKMIKQAQKHYKYVEYFGYDLWEMFRAKDVEFCNKTPATRKEAEERLKKTGAKYTLFQGNTQQMLPNTVRILPPIDFVWFDGGHSLETIESDWKNIKLTLHSKSVVLFDDYYIGEIGQKFGCRTLIHSLPVEIYEVEFLQPIDKVNGGTQIVKVSLYPPEYLSR